MFSPSSSAVRSISSPISPTQLPLPPSPQLPSTQFETLVKWLKAYPSKEPEPWKNWTSCMDLTFPVTQYGGTCLHLAVAKQCFSFLEYLVDLKLSIPNKRALNSSEGDNLSPLMLGCLMGDIKMVKLLTQLETDINRQCSLNGWTSLMYSAISSNEAHEKIKLLKGLGGDIEVHSWLGMTFSQLEAKLPAPDPHTLTPKIEKIKTIGSESPNASTSDPKKWFADWSLSARQSPLSSSKVNIILSQSSPLEALNNSSQGLLAQLGLLSKSQKE
ncbi:Ankyrin repeat and SAM domain-containing protein 6 [Coelomomyces lativittatus]|nr:Ankyrin repeat and SAM domain-containing protein 6 [Coelomomyces lativittatus]KAJ1504862.1 Ankyrin repeat and SAM domain-containing protein 6 [Coelomomyces lativittatus]KAJ1505261.1 Ankyrin repeat and SAM domain-containing protein 6 [Coelomomyces lativittatus]